jgi:hypothetical protein
VVEYLRAHREDLDRLIAHLAHAPTARWPVEVGTVHMHEFEGTHIHAIKSVLMAEVLWQEHRGGHEQAALALEALWRLGRALAEHPQYLTRVVGEDFASRAFALLPRLKAVPATWPARLAELDPHGDLEERLDLYTLELWALRRTEKDAGRLLEPGTRNLAIAARRTVAEYAAHAPCALNEAALNARLQMRLGYWGFVLPFLSIEGQTWDRTDRQVVEVELARKLLDLRVLREANAGIWPAAVPGIEASACQGARWNYGVAPDGRMSLTLVSRSFADRPPLTFSASAGPVR